MPVGKTMVLFPRSESEDKKEKSIQISYLSVLKIISTNISTSSYPPTRPLYRLYYLCEKVFISIIFGKYFQFPAQFF